MPRHKPLQPGKSLELFLAVFQIDRVDDALALAIGERQFDGLRIGRIDHDRRLHLTDELFVERRDVLHFIAVGGLQTHIHDVRAVAHLTARDLRSFFPFSSAIRFLNSAGADHIGPLTHDKRSIGFVCFHQLDTAVIGLVASPESRAAFSLPPFGRSREIWAGVVPQQPPIRFSHP